MLAAGLTAFYMSRLFFMTFHGRRRWDAGAHPHEAPALMTVPMIVLAVGSVFLGGLLTIGGAFVNWLSPVVGEAEHHEPVLSVPVITGITLVLVAIGVLLAWRQYAAADVPVVQPRGSLATVAARRDLFQDDVNEAVFMRPGQYLTRSLVYADTKGVDGAVGGIAGLVAGSAGWLRKFQTGFVRSYAASMLVGVVVLLGALVVVR
jgi:NADH-quinone oxidoreductase subunit L